MIMIYTWIPLELAFVAKCCNIITFAATILYIIGKFYNIEYFENNSQQKYCKEI